MSIETIKGQEVVAHLHRVAYRIGASKRFALSNRLLAKAAGRAMSFVQ